VPNQQGSVCAPAPLSSCLASASQRSVLVLRDGASPAKNLLKWKIVRGGLATAANLHDPVTGDAVLAVCVYDASGAAQPLLAGTVPPGGTCGTKPCWRSVAAGYRYKNRAATGDGVTDLRLRVGHNGEVQLVVKGKGAMLPMPTLGLVPPVRVQLVVGDPSGTTCWQSTFPSAVKNDGATFKANGS
jgi:hypothetical protein